MTTLAPELSTRFSDRLAASILSRRSAVCVGLDPDLDSMPPAFVAETAARGAADEARPAMSRPTDGEALAAACCAGYCRRIIAAVADVAAAVKPQAAYFEQYGAAGWRALCEVVRVAHEHELPVIVDVKRGDIAATAQAYANAVFGGAPLPGGGRGAGLDADAVTVNPYMGADSLEPFVRRCDQGRGIFVLTRTSNPGAADLQERHVDPQQRGAGVAGRHDAATTTGDHGARPLYLVVADMVSGLGDGAVGERGYVDVGAVAGATAPDALRAVREALPRSFILVPGIGAQGGEAEALRGLSAGEAGGLVVNSSRSILYAWRRRGGDFASAAAQACEELRDRLAGVLWP